MKLITKLGVFTSLSVLSGLAMAEEVTPPNYVEKFVKAVDLSALMEGTSEIGTQLIAASLIVVCFFWIRRMLSGR